MPLPPPRPLRPLGPARADGAGGPGPRLHPPGGREARLPYRAPIIEAAPTGLGVGQRPFRPGETLHAPYLIDLEVCVVLRRYAAAGDLDPRRGQQAVEHLLDLPLSRHAHDVLLPRIWQLRHAVTTYDAAYLALAEALAAPLVTRDASLAAAGRRFARVELISGQPSPRLRPPASP